MYYNLLSSMSSGVIAPSYTARTTAFATATGIVDTTILNALNTFDLGLISNGLDTKMKALYPFVGGTATTHKYNFMDARDLDAAFRLQFNGGWVHSTNGIQGNATNTYANTFLNENTVITANSEHISIYSRTDVDGLYCDMGVVTSGDVETNIFSKLSNKSYYRINNTSAGVSNLNTSLGLFIATRNSSNWIEGYNKNIKSDIPSTFITKINAPIYIGAFNYSNMSTFSLPTSRQYSFSSIGDGLTTTDASTLYTLTQAMQTSLSRQV